MFLRFFLNETLQNWFSLFCARRKLNARIILQTGSLRALLTWVGATQFEITRSKVSWWMFITHSRICSAACFIFNVHLAKNVFSRGRERCVGPFNGPKLSREKIPRNVLHLIAQPEWNWFGISAALADADLFWLCIFAEYSFYRT